jgi:hydrogenase/urease accessory protein HupE
MRSRLARIPAACLLWASCPGQASAHLVNSGFGPFYDGIAHLLVTPEDLLVVVAISLLAGLGGKQYGRSVLFLLPLAWLTGAAAGQMTPLTAGMPILSALLLIGLGVLVAVGLSRRLSRHFVAGFALVVGLAHGFFNGAAMAGANSGSLAIVGIVCAVFVIVALLAGQVVSLQKEWGRIAVRVAGSWIGAVGLLMLGWTTR